MYSQVVLEIIVDCLFNFTIIAAELKVLMIITKSKSSLNMDPIKNMDLSKVEISSIITSLLEKVTNFSHFGIFSYIGYLFQGVLSKKVDATLSFEQESGKKRLH